MSIFLLCDEEDYNGKEKIWGIIRAESKEDACRKLGLKLIMEGRRSFAILQYENEDGGFKFRLENTEEFWEFSSFKDLTEYFRDVPFMEFKG